MTSEEFKYEEAFSRNIGILESAEQKMLQLTTVAIVGLGGIGSNVAPILARMGFGGFILVDFDKYDMVNVNRQFGAKCSTFGQSKVDVMEREIKDVNPSARITVYKEELTEENSDKILDNADIVVDAIDFYCIPAHIILHRKARQHNLFIVMGSPVGFSACLQVYDPKGMDLETYCGITEDMPELEMQMRYACGVVPKLAHIDYFDVSDVKSNTDFMEGTGPSIASACVLASSLVATEVGLILLGRRKVKAIPYTFQFDPYMYRYENAYLDGGMTQYDPSAVIDNMKNQSSMVVNIFDLLYRKSKADKLSVKRGEICFRQAGEHQNTLLLLSPLGSDTNFWSRQLPHFSKTHRVITLDNRGVGNSSPALPGMTTEDMADDAIAVLEYLKVTKVAIVGLALGGLIGQQIALKRADLVEKLILISSYDKANETTRKITEQWRQTAIEKGTKHLFEACLDWLFSAEYVASNRGELDKLKTFYRLYLQNPVCFVRQSLAGVNHDTSEMLHAIGCSTLVISSTEDRFATPQHGRAMAQKMPNAQYLEINNGAHFSTWEQSDIINEEISQFLAG